MTTPSSSGRASFVENTVGFTTVSFPDAVHLPPLVTCRGSASVFNVFRSWGSIFVELVHPDVLVEVDAPARARGGDFGLRPTGGGVEVGSAWIAVDRDGPALGAPARGMAVVGGCLPAAHIFFVLRPTRGLFEPPRGRLRSDVALKVDNPSVVLPLVEVADDADESVDCLPAMLVLNGEVPIGDELRLLVQRVRKRDRELAAGRTEVTVFLVDSDGVAADFAVLGVIVEVLHGPVDLNAELLDNNSVGDDGDRDRGPAGGIRSHAGHIGGCWRAEEVDAEMNFD